MAAGPETCIQDAAVLPEERASSMAGAFLLLTKPGIVLAETAAGFAGLLLASRGLPSSPAAVVCCLLSLIMAASGAAMANCVLETDTDRKMTRLAERSRALTTAGRAWVLTIALLLMGGAFLLAGVFLNLLTLLLLAAACGSYLLLYTLWLKHRSPWGVLAGAIPGALPPLIGAAAVSGGIAALPLLLSAVIFIWQLPHFWFLALQYSDQYRLAGIPVLPTTHGIKLTKRLTLLFSAALLPVTLSFSLTGSGSSVFTFVILLAGILFLLFCHRVLFRTCEYRKGYVTSIAYLATIFAALITDTILR
jgi:heme o synthase